MAITFAVDDVAPAAAPRPTRALAASVGPHLTLGAPACAVIDTPDMHPLLAAVHTAFAEHRPLVLSPDALWLTIAQGAALHVRLHAEELRQRLVRHSGREHLQVLFPGMPASADDWAAVVAGFRAAVADVVGEGRARLLACNFSTTTPEAAVASEIVLMDVYAPYFEYDLLCVCGIPEITLLGTPEDWRTIRQRLDVVAELDLGFWTRSLVPIAEQLVATAEGRPDVAFWRDIYKPEEAYGSDRVTGWIARLFPYGGRQGRFDERNPLLDFPLGQLPPRNPKSFWYDGPGMAPDWAPRGTSQVLVHLLDRGAGGGDKDVILEGGLLGIEQDAAGRLAAVPGWLARPPTVSTAALVERLRTGPHHVEPVAASKHPPTGSLEIVTLYRELGGATLFAGAGEWRLRPMSQHQRIRVPVVEGTHFDVTRILDLPDRTTVAVAHIAGSRRFVLLRIDDLRPLSAGEEQKILVEDPAGECQTTQHTTDVPVLEGTLTAILARALDTGGATDLPLSGQTLDDVVPHWVRIPPPSEAERRARREAETADRAERRRKKAARQAELRARLVERAPPSEPDPDEGPHGT
jgi:hypothetical protein